MNLQAKRPPAVPAANGLNNLTEFYKPDFTTKPCICGREFSPGQAFVITETPIITITRVCADCSATLASGSFAERGEFARLLLARAKGGER